MQEEGRMVRCYSEDTERPYFQIRYRLSLTGRELLSDALGGGGGGNSVYRSNRSGSVSTTVTVHENKELQNMVVDSMVLDDMTSGEQKFCTGRTQRTRSLEAPSDNSHIAGYSEFSSQIPGTPRSSRHQKRFNMENQQFHHHHQNGDYMDTQNDDPLNGNYELRRTKSAGTASELQLHRGAPAIPVASLYDSQDHLKVVQSIYPQFASEFRGLVTCLNSKNVRKYRIGQSYRKGVIIGIDETQGKIVVFQKNMPVGTLIVMRTENPTRYEKGYTVQDVQGRTLGSVHAIDKAQKLLVVNTSIASGNSSLYNIQY